MFFPSCPVYYVGMDFGSPDKNLEETSKEEGPPYIRELDLNLLRNKEEQGGNSFQDETEALDDNMQGYANQEKISDYTDEGLMSTIEDYENYNKMQGADHVDFSGQQLDTSAKKLSNELEPRDSYPCFDKPVLSADKNDNSYEVVDNGTYDYQSAKSPSLIATENGDVGNISGNSQLGNTELSNEEMDDENFSHDTKMKEGDYPEEMVASDNGGMVREYSGLHSPPKMRNDTSSPEGNLSDPMEGSPYGKPSARQEPLSPENNNKKSAPSPSQSKRKHSPSPEKHAVGHKRSPSHDRLSPPIRRKSPQGMLARRDSHHRDDSPRKRLSVSPRRRDSLRRRDRSASRSPVRRDSSGSRRDHHGKSRSRSPYVRDRYQRSPR